MGFKFKVSGLDEIFHDPVNLKNHGTMLHLVACRMLSINQL